MTREEIIEGLKLLEDNMVYFDELRNDKGEYIDVHELLFEAIEVLEQEPCNNCDYKEWLKGEIEQEPCADCISRKEAIEVLKNNYRMKALDEIQSLPSVQPKTGHWIAQDIHNCHTDFRCSECGYIYSFMHLYGKPTADYTYCPKCGAKMLPTDSDKEWLPQYEGKWVTEKE